MLKDVFGVQDLLFGGKKTQRRNTTKVAITATATKGKLQPVIMTNYNRREGTSTDGKLPDIHRSHNTTELGELILF